MGTDMFDKPADEGEMTTEELEIAQWRIDVTDAGLKKIDEIYGEYWSDQTDKKRFGKIFKKAVTTGRLKRVELFVENGREVLASDRQLQYVVG